MILKCLLRIYVGAEEKKGVLSAEIPNPFLTPLRGEFSIGLPHPTLGALMVEVISSEPDPNGKDHLLELRMYRGEDQYLEVFNFLRKIGWLDLEFAEQITDNTARTLMATAE